ncbi:MULTISPECIES: hypothetical protein [Mesorhizobium]|uniref:hypothetical protein n=1 Tax=Mesorhizobium TaxID=68287 RepID=UPI001FE03626|nr:MULTISPECIES: hypothetical protein [Mesorhizobium]
MASPRPPSWVGVTFVLFNPSLNGCAIVEHAPAKLREGQAVRLLLVANDREVMNT